MLVLGDQQSWRTSLPTKFCRSISIKPCRVHLITDNYFPGITEGLAKLTSNEYLVLAGTLHGIHAITSRLAPVGSSSGAQVIEGESFKMTILLTATGVCIFFSSTVLIPICFEHRHEIRTAHILGGDLCGNSTAESV
jgi:hypothetical protein